MDIYTPDGDTVTNRPVILYLHGGAFYAGEKGSVDCVDFCTSYAKKGYVAISANYRLAPNALTFAFYQDIQYITVLQAVADIKAAVRYKVNLVSHRSNHVHIIKPILACASAAHVCQEKDW